MSDLTQSELESLSKLIDQYKWVEDHNKIDQFEPYPWQLKVYNKYDEDGQEARVRHGKRQATRADTMPR